MKTIIILTITLCVPLFFYAQTPQNKKTKPTPTFGANTQAGRTFVHDGVKLYYEVYGKGEPLLLVHGNGGSISDFRRQIPFFSKNFKVIAMDSRNQGKSGDGVGKLTYEVMADDLAALIEHLKLGSVYVLGWSDGAIEGLLLAMRHPLKVKKLAAMAANLNPTDEAVSAEVVEAFKPLIDAANAAPDTSQSRREKRVMALLLSEPNIDPKRLSAITAPTLVLAGDRDVIRDEHTLAIYRHIANSQLAILPNSTHMVPYDDPEMFNSTVFRFFKTPFVKKNRVNDLFKSLEKLKSGN